MSENTDKIEEQGANLIHASALCSLTNLSDRRLRQLAKEGYFPPGRNGVYQKNETLKGLFKFYQEQEARAAEELRKEEVAYTRARRRKAELELEEKIGAVVPTEVADYCFANIFVPFRQRLYRLPIDVSYDCEGKSRAQIQARIEDGIDKLLEEHRASFDCEEFHNKLMEEIGVKKPKGEDEERKEETDGD